MIVMLKLTSPLVSPKWLHQHINEPNLVLIDATIKKVTDTTDSENAPLEQLPKARFLDIKNTFSDTTAMFPNTMLSPQKFTMAARALGINASSAIVVYDALGIYASARVWYMFKAMGHQNIAVLNGGLPEWKKAGYSCEKRRNYAGGQGDFTAAYQPDFFCDFTKVQNAIKQEAAQILDARSSERFYGKVPEPRQGLRSGHIPTSKNLPYTALLENGILKDKKALQRQFNTFQKENTEFIFSCGSGITACILALGAEIARIKNIAVYDGSWTEWGSLVEE
ncbi:MAG TPA: sulfurtransferase [Flavobacteriia bacterium]|nr:sulfurtransferase [Flavobacteriia bacterium]